MVNVLFKNHLQIIFTLTATMKNGKTVIKCTGEFTAYKHHSVLIFIIFTLILLDVCFAWISFFFFFFFVADKYVYVIQTRGVIINLWEK